MKYVLVHGAWHGAWCWSLLKKKLIQAGINVYTPDLPGHGVNHHDFRTINLSTYVEAIKAVLMQLSGNIILVGHSMAGMVISQVGEALPDKIAGLIYVAAFMPKDQQSLSDLAEQFNSPGISAEAEVDLKANSITLRRSDKLRDIFYNQCSQDIADQALARLTAEPFRPFIEPVSLSKANFGRIKKYYIHCLSDNTISAQDQQNMFIDRVDNVLPLNSDHSPFYSQVQQLSKLLLSVIP